MTADGVDLYFRSYGHLLLQGILAAGAPPPDDTREDTPPCCTPCGEETEPLAGEEKDATESARACPAAAPRDDLTACSSEREGEEVEEDIAPEALPHPNPEP